MKPSYFVTAVWDPEASVWISETDIPGLVIEAETLGEFERLMLELGPEMLAANEHVRDASVPIVFQARQHLALLVA